MLAVNQLRQLPQSFQQLLDEANGDVWRPEFHHLDYPGRFLDLVEVYAGSARISTLCSQVF